MNWSRRRVGIRIRNRLVVHNRSGTASWRDNEGFNAETANEIGNSPAVFVGREVALIPGQAERSIGQLDDESVELRLRWQAGCFQVHDFNIA
jgi:hypothetical protein